MGIIGEPGINITRLIEIFGRPIRAVPAPVARTTAGRSGWPISRKRNQRGTRVSLRTRLALVFIAATLIPLGATVWLTTLLLDQQPAAVARRSAFGSFAFAREDRP